MPQLYRDQFAHYINVTPNEDSKKWELEGIGVDALSMQFNAQVDQYKTIISRNADAIFNGYQIQSAVSGKRIHSDDPIYTFLDEARRKATSIETELLEIDMANTKTTGSYVAVKYDILIVINEFLGENATISYDLYVKGSPIQGTASISNKKPEFTETV